MHGRKRNRNFRYARGRNQINVYRPIRAHHRMVLPRTQAVQKSQITTHQIPVKTYQQKAPPIERIRQEQKQDSLNWAKFDNIKTKINEIKQRIDQEIENRKEFIQKNISEDPKCFEKNDENLIQLTQEFIDFLLSQENYKFLEKRRVKKRLQNVRFNLEKGAENIFVYRDGIPFFGSEKKESVLGEASSDWKKWKDLINLIGTNIDDYLLFLKKNELNNLYDEYESIRFPKKKEDVIICEKCGSENLLKAVYCHYCGHELNGNLQEK